MKILLVLTSVNKSTKKYGMFKQSVFIFLLSASTLSRSADAFQYPRIGFRQLQIAGAASMAMSLYWLFQPTVEKTCSGLQKDLEPYKKCKEKHIEYMISLIAINSALILAGTVFILAPYMIQIARATPAELLARNKERF